MTEPFTPPSMLDMPFASLNARRAAQEDAYIAFCEARDAAAHKARAQHRIAQNHAFTNPVAPRVEAAASPVVAASHMPGVDALLDRLVGGRAA